MAENILEKAETQVAASIHNLSRASAAMADAIDRARPVVTAEGLDSAVDAFGSLVGDRPGWGEAIIWDRIPRSSPLAPVARGWLRQNGQVHAQLARTQKHAFALAELDVSRIPTLADPRFLPPRWVRVQRPEVTMRRAALSLAVARLAGAGTWADAGDSIQIDQHYAAKLVGHTLRSVGGPAAAELTEAAFAYARMLSRGNAPQCERPDGSALRSAAELRRFARQLSSTARRQLGAQH